MISRSIRYFLQPSMTSRPRPIIAVIGTTGVGKSQFAIDLARSASPRKSLVLSADSMQLYEGLPVITNKVNEEEMMGVEHWGLDVVKPGQGGAWEIGRWINEAQKRVSVRMENAGRQRLT
jgi:tRNA dimethylallyltransferase